MELSPQKLFQEAMRLFKESRYGEAVLLLEKAIAIDAASLDAYEALGVMYRKLGRMEDAIAVFKKLSWLDPHHVMAHSNLSQIYMEQGKISEAEAEQAEARRLTWREELKERQSSQPSFSFEEQIERYKKVIAFDPTDMLGYFSLAGVYAMQKKWDEAEAAYKKALEINPQHSSSYFGLGQALQEQGKVKEAMVVFERGIPVAEKQGDMIPFKKMSARLNELKSK